MKGKLLWILGVAAAVTFSFGLAACNAGDEKGEAPDAAKADWTVERVFAQAKESGYTGTEQELGAMLAAHELADLGTENGGEHRAHVFPEWTVILAPACNSIGISFRQCTLCREAEWEFSPATSHSYGEPRVIKQPTCSEKGLALLTCANCGATFEQELKEGDHVFEAGWSYDVSSHFHRATCGHDEVSERTPHTFQGGLCTVCGMPSGTYLVPVAYTGIAMYFGENITPWEYLHNGVDFIAEVGAEVVATAAGVVTNLGGDMLIIAHANGVESHYRCIEIDPALKVGDSVLQGQKIGTVAAAPNYESDVPHLCFELTFDKQPEDPLPYLGIES